MFKFPQYSQNSQNYYFYGINEKVNKEIINNLLEDYKNHKLILYNIKPINLPEFYNQLNEEDKNYCIQSFTCLDPNPKKLATIFTGENRIQRNKINTIKLSVCRNINSLRITYMLNSETLENSKKILDIIEKSKNYDNIYSWLDSLEINELYKYFKLLKNDIDITFDNNYFIKKLLLNKIDVSSIFFGDASKLMECINEGLVEFCIKYKTEKKIVKLMLEYIYSQGIEKPSSLNIQSQLNFDIYYHLDNSEYNDPLKYSKIIIDKLHEYKFDDSTSDIILKFYLDKFEKCYNYLI